MGIEITVDLDACGVTAHCVDVAPEVFEINEEGEVEVLLPHPEDPAQIALARAAEGGCPTAAIAIVETS